MSNSNRSVLRRLTKLEVIYDDELHHNNLICTRSFLVQTASDSMLAKLDLTMIKKACLYWTECSSPLLSAQISRHGDDRHFVRMRPNELQEFANVELIESDHFFKWVEIMDKEIVTPFRMDKGPLWRMRVIKLSKIANPFGAGAKKKSARIPFQVTANGASSNSRDQTSGNSEYNLVFILTTQMTLGDEPVLFEWFTRFLNILAALLENRKCVEMDQAVNSVVEDLVKLKPAPKSIAKSNTTNLGSKRLNLMPQGSQDKCITNSNEVKTTVTTIFDQVSRVSSTLANPFDDSCAQFKHFYLEAEEFKRLVVATRHNCQHASLAGLVSTIIGLAFRQIYQKYHVTDIPVQKIQYYIQYNMREKLKLKSSETGTFNVDIESVIYSDELRTSQFWQTVEKKSVYLDKRIGEIQQSSSSTVCDVDNCHKQIKENKYSESNVNFALSHIGRFRNSELDNKALRVRQHYVRMPCICDRFGSSFRVSLTMIENKLCWSLSFSESRMSTNIVNELIAQILSIVRYLGNEKRAN